MKQGMNYGERVKAAVAPPGDGGRGLKRYAQAVRLFWQ